jgi:large subunit ribosomal protein L11
MAPRRKKIAALVKVQLQAGQATPAPPVGTALGPHGVNIMDFVKQYNAATDTQRGTSSRGDHDLRGPVVLLHHQDPARAWELIKKAAGVQKKRRAAQDQGRHDDQGAGPGHRRDQDEGPQRQVHRGRREDHRGTARSMGITVAS